MGDVALTAAISALVVFMSISVLYGVSGSSQYSCCCGCGYPMELCECKPVLGGDPDE